MSKYICQTCKNKDFCNETLRLYGIPNTRVTECKAYEEVEHELHYNECKPD